MSKRDKVVRGGVVHLRFGRRGYVLASLPAAVSQSDPRWSKIQKLLDEMAQAPKKKVKVPA